MQSQKIAKPLCYTCRTQEMWKRIAIKNVFMTGGIKHTIWTQNHAAHVLKHRKMKILDNIIIFLFIDVIVHVHVIIANHASFLSRIAAVVTRTGSTAVVNECKKLSVLGELLHGKKEEYMFWCLHPAPVYALPVQQILCHREDLLACVVRLRTNNFLPSADTSCWVLSALSTIHASTLYPEEGTRSISTPSLTRLSPTLEATTFDLVLLAAHAEEVKCGMVKVLVFICVPWYLTWQWLIYFLNTITWLDQNSHKVAFAFLAVHKRPYLSCSWGGDEHFISESFFQMHMLNSKRQGSDSCLTKVAVIQSANLRQPNNSATMNDPLFYVVKGSGKGGGCWEISVLIRDRLWPTGTSGFLLVFANTVESLGPGLVPITAFIVTERMSLAIRSVPV